MEAVESMFRTSFWEVPAFMRVEPAIASGPTRGTIDTSAIRQIFPLGFELTAIVRAPRFPASRSAARV